MRGSILLIVFIFLSCAPAIAGNVRLEWAANTEPDLKGYRIYCGSTSGVYGKPIDAGNVTSYTITALPPGTYYFAVTAYNTAKQESGYSNEVSTTIVRDTIPPVVSFASPVPAGNYVSAGATIPVAGNASDNDNITGVYWRCHGAVGIAEGTTSWSVPSIPLLPGDNFITVTALDAAGNAGQALINAIYRPAQPVITKVSIIELSSTSVEIRWLTSIPTDSLVEYGTNTPYSSSALDSRPVYSHSVTLTNLVPGTLYHYRLKSSDLSVVSQDYQFTLGSVARTYSLPRLFTPGSSSGTSGTPGSSSPQSQTVGNHEYVSVALTNFDSVPATLTFTAYDTEGNQVSGEGIINPATRTLEPGAQMPVISEDLFGFTTPGLSPSGWIKLESSVARLSGFFLMFDGSLTELDGALLTSSPLNTVLLPDIQDQGYTRLNITNTNYDTGTLQIDLVRSEGTTRASKSIRVAGRGSLITDVYGDLFTDIAPVASDYIRVRSSSNLSPYELVGKTGQDVAVLGGLDTTAAASVLYAPQYAVGGTWRSTLSIINLDSITGSVTLSLFNEAGSQIGESKTRDIAPLGKLYIDDQAFFTQAGQNVVQGYVQIAGNGIRLTGSLRFNDAGGAGLDTALPLVSSLSSSIVFGHIASDSQYYTGIAILNPNNQNASVRIDLYGPDGLIQSTKLIPLSARQRLSKILTELFPDLTKLLEKDPPPAYIRVTADQGVAGFALFGTNDLKVLSAIPAQPAP